MPHSAAEAISTTSPIKAIRLACFSVCIGISVSIVWFALTAHLGLDLSDEGYFWYGSQRVALGEVPIRDFMSYDVGRYAYAASILRMLGDSGIMAARVAAYSFIAIFVSLAFFLVVDSARRRGDTIGQKLVVGGAAILLPVLWVYPYYKVFDFTPSLLLTLAIYALFARRSSLAWFLLGVVVGLVATIGRNHGVYGVVASILAYVILLVKAPDNRPTGRSVVLWALGICVGYAPVLWMLVFTDGFADPFIDWIVAQIRSGQTNIGLPIPWPWLVPIDIAQNGVVYTAYLVSVSCGFLLLIVLPIIAIVRVALVDSIDDTRAAPAVALCVAIPYAQYAFSRADVVHLAAGIIPVLVGVLMALDSRRLPVRVLIIGFFTAFSVFALYESPPINYWLTQGERWQKTKVGSAELIVENPIALKLSHRESVLQGLGRDQAFLALPNMPALHAAHEQRMAVHDIYILAATSPAQEISEIARLEVARPALILISDRSFDGHESWRFSLLRPMTYEWINRNYRKSVSITSNQLDPLEVYIAR